jgi:hypothetical protein
MFASGETGASGSSLLTAPSVDAGARPDTISDPRIGLDLRAAGQPGSPIRVGIGAQFIVPSGDRADYTSDGTRRAMVRLLLAGDRGRLSYAGQIGVHVRPRDDALVPGGPVGSELLFGIAIARRFDVHSNWTARVGPEVYGETALRASVVGAGMEGLVTTRFERATGTRGVRIKVAAGGGLIRRFGAPSWRLAAAAELFGHAGSDLDSSRPRQKTDRRGR